MNNEKRFLIVRPDRIGDVVLSTPIPREIKKSFPNSFVAVFISKYTEDIYINNPYVDAILLTDDYDDGSLQAFVKKVKELRTYRFTHAFNLLPKERINYLLFFAGIPCRIGEGMRLYQVITFTKHVSRHKYIPVRHEADYCLDIARKIGINVTSIDPEIHLTSDELNEVTIRKVKMIGSKKVLVGVHATSGKSAPNWLPSDYKKLIDRLLMEPDVQIVITDNRIPSVLKNIPDVLYPNQNNRLRDSILNIGAVDLLISASTGTMHVAASLKVPTLSLFCPTSACSPQRWGPIGNHHTIVMPNEENCDQTCKVHPSECTFRGTSGISVERVFKEAMDEIHLYKTMNETNKQKKHV